MEFLQVLRRFLAIRGRTAVILSDNGSQFVGAEKELRQMVGDINEGEAKEFCGEKGMQWKFIMPGAPHHNGCAEALVKTGKRALKKAVGSQVPTPSELYTVLLEVANLVNQRPIGGTPNDQDDAIYICPNNIPYLPVYKSIPCISRPSILGPKNMFFLFLCKNFLEKTSLLS